MDISSPLYRRFPLWAFNPFRRSQVAWRLGNLAEWILSKLSVPAFFPKPASDINYATMAGKAHLLQLRESLITVARTWSAVPRLTVLSDGSWSKTDAESFLEWWPQNLRFVNPEDVRANLRKQGRAKLASFTVTHPLSLKLGFIVAEACYRRCFFADSDILWFKDPSNLLSGHNWEAGVAATVESTGSLNRELARQICPEMLNPPFINTGVILLSGQLFGEPQRMDEILTKIKTPNHEFNEQTIIAAAVRSGGQILPQDFMINDFDRPFDPWPKHLNGKGGHARHYVRFMRHLLYRDALILRCGRIGRSIINAS
jgi:hypothetical protein